MGTLTASEPRTRPAFSPRQRAQPRTRIVFVCVGNSCRSQMAEGWARHLGQGSVEAMSAGLRPLGFITPETIQVMAEKKVSLDGQRSKDLLALNWEDVDVLVNMTGLPGRSLVPGFCGQQLDWRVRDPFDEPLRIYRQVRDQLERKVRELLGQLQAPSSRGPAAPPAF